MPRWQSLWSALTAVQGDCERDFSLRLAPGRFAFAAPTEAVSPSRHSSVSAASLCYHVTSGSFCHSRTQRGSAQDLEIRWKKGIQIRFIVDSSRWVLRCCARRLGAIFVVLFAFCVCNFITGHTQHLSDAAWLGNLMQGTDYNIQLKPKESIPAFCRTITKA